MLAGLAAPAIGLSACATEEPRANPPIFVGAPWVGSERLEYDLSERGELEGRCVLETELEVAPGVTELRRSCTNADEPRYHDNATVQVQADSLRPISTVRSIIDLEEDERRFSATYLAGQDLVRFVLLEYEIGVAEPREQLNTERDLPAPTDDVSAPGWYDDESLLWLVRGVPLEEGFEGAFTDVTATTRVFDADLSVEGREEVEVPAGTFEAWKIRIQTSTVTQFAWVDVESPHRVVRARIERLTYELTAVD